MRCSKIGAYPITSSARASTDGGTSRPSALVVLRVEDRFVPGRRLHRQVGRLLALEDTVDVASGLPQQVQQIGPIGDHPAALDLETIGVDRRQPGTRSQIHHQRAVRHRLSAGRDQPAARRAREGGDGAARR